jgi:Mg2+ and Co2+ transporter CorA
MRKDSINNEALEKAYVIFNERGLQTVDFDFSHSPTDYNRNTVREPEQTSIVEGAYHELTPANVSNGFRYEDLESQAKALNLRIDSQQDKLRVCRLRGNFQEFHRCMKEMQDMIKEKERLDAKMAVATPGGNAGEKQMDDYDRTYDQDDSYSEIVSLSSRIDALEKMILEYSEDTEG